MSHSISKRVKVCVTGAAGQIGYALLFRIASGQMFGPTIGVDLNLLEREQALPALNGVAMELEDCAFPLLGSITCTADPKVAFEGVNWCLLVGSVPRKEGMERADLLQTNANVFVEQGRIINEKAARDVRIFVVGNPCNSNCMIAHRHAPDIPADRFFAMTLLDENRAKSQLATKAGVAVSKVTNMLIWGNHSANQFPDFYHALIEGKPATEVIKDETWLKETFIPVVQQRGSAIIKARGLSSAASAANAVIDSINRLTQDTPPGDFFSMSMVSQGDYHVEPGLVFSYPARVENGQLTIVQNLSLNAYQQAKIDKVIEELKQERDILQKLNML